MYICVCHAISEKTVKQHLGKGVSSLGELRRILGCRSSCGQCTCYLQSMINDFNVLEPHRGSETDACARATGVA
ncbi:MAG: (2Fe-2S)-binding protein [Gammaproteobacteria bacterium]|nr:(2Fe-2S)-binding protein [Gammaproteobacteria bacterium]